MVAVDTNFVVRLLTLDDGKQAARANRLFSSNRIFLPKTVLLETEWVLRRLYKFEREQVTAALRDLIAVYRPLAVRRLFERVTSDASGVAVTGEAKAPFPPKDHSSWLRRRGSLCA